MKKAFVSPIIAILVGLIVIAAIAASSFYIGKKSSAPSTSNTPAQISQENKLLVDLVSETKTYSNPEIGFTFDYPKTFEVNSYGSLYPDDFEIQISSPIEYRDEDAMHIALRVAYNTENMTLEKFLQDVYGKPYNPGGNPEITVEGKWKDFKMTNAPLPGSYSYIGDFGGGGQSKVQFFSYKDKFYTVVLYGGEGAGAGYSPEAEKVYDQILPTFKFTQ